LVVVLAPAHLLFGKGHTAGLDPYQRGKGGHGRTG
jgi:hypothetical protein